MPPDASPPARPGRGSIRWRLIGGLFLILLGTLGFVGGGLYAVVRGQIDERVRAEQELIASQFEILATQGVNPDTGQPFTDPEPLLEVMLERAALPPSAGILGIVGDGVRWEAPTGVRLRLEDDPQLEEHLVSLAGGADVVTGGCGPSSASTATWWPRSGSRAARRRARWRTPPTWTPSARRCTR